MLTRRNLETLKNWGNALFIHNEVNWTKHDTNLLGKLIQEIEDYNHTTYKQSLAARKGN